MVTVGVTGGIGSGKSSVCRVWEKLGAEVVYADKLAKELMTENQEIKKRIESLFGSRSYRGDGSLNRKYLAAQAFDNGRVEELNSIVHPVVRNKIMKFMKQAEQRNTEMFVEEAALLLMNGRPPEFDYIIVVNAKEENRIKWVTQRDRTEIRVVMSRMAKQQPLKELISYSDFVIENDSTLQNLEKKASDLYERLLDR